MGELPLKQTVERQEQLKNSGIERLTKPQMIATASAFAQDLQAGIQGHRQSLATIPTHLHPVARENLSEGQSSLVVEIGGTNVRAAVIAIDADKNPQIISEGKKALSSDTKRNYDSSESFFDEVADTVVPLAQNYESSALGIIWSFPTDSVGEYPNGIDAISSSQLPKELVIQGIDERPVGDMIIESLQRKGLRIAKDTPRAVANDTAAVLLANNATLGGIVGTGFNFAFLHGGQMYNLEAGGFTNVPQTLLTQELDAKSKRPGHYLAEKQVSGHYVGEEVGLALTKFGFGEKVYSGEEVSAILAERTTDFNSSIIKEIAEIFRDRSAQIVASMVAGTIDAFPQDFPDNEIIIPIDGSFFGKTPGYQEKITHYVHELVGDKNIQFVYVENSGIKGAGVAALGLLAS